MDDPDATYLVLVASALADGTDHQRRRILDHVTPAARRGAPRWLVLDRLLGIMGPVWHPVAYGWRDGLAMLRQARAEFTW